MKIRIKETGKNLNWERANPNCDIWHDPESFVLTLEQGIEWNKESEIYECSQADFDRWTKIINSWQDEVYEGKAKVYVLCREAVFFIPSGKEGKK